MNRPIVYDLTRLTTRFLNPTPNGIDRVDFAYAEHFLSEQAHDAEGFLSLWNGRRLVDARAAGTIMRRLSHHWREGGEAGEDPGLDRVLAFVSGSRATQTLDRAARIQERRSGPANLAALLANVTSLIGKPPRQARRNAVYLNVSQFPLWFPPYFRWLEDRPDIKPVFLIHDLLPIDYPEYFRRGEFERHRRRLQVVCQRAAAVITTSAAVKARLADHLTSLGCGALPVHVAHLPVADAFSAPALAHDSAGPPYFVICSTIEPRKNHLLLLTVWREMVRDLGAAAPRLVIVGARGWENENVVDLIERCPDLRGHVVEIAGLTTPGLERLMDGARAVLYPSFAEGYGLPLAEALTAGAPVIASDIPVFREIGGDAPLYVSPLDGLGWMGAIRAMSGAVPGPRPVPSSRITWDAYFRSVEAFIDGL